MQHLLAYVLSGITASVMSIIMGCCFLFISVPNTPLLANYKKTRKLLAMAYFILGLGNVSTLISIFLGITPKETTLFTIVLTIAAFQAFLFTYTLITLLNPNFLKISQFIRQALYIFSFLFAIIIAAACGSATMVRTFNYLFYLFYLGQLFYYTYIFFKEKKKCTMLLGDFYSGNEEKKLNWVRTAFLSSLTIGVLVAVNLLNLQIKYLICLILFYSVFYIYFAIKFLNYPHVFAVLQKSFNKQPEQPVSSIPYSQLTENIEKWVLSKGFLNSNLTIHKLASELNTNRSYLSECINSTMQMNFSTWINTLRINEALLLMQQYPEWSISRISEETGFTDSTCFGKHFKKITGQTPRMVKEKYQRSHMAHNM